MNTKSISAKWFSILSGISGILGVFLLAVSFLINPSPPPHPTIDQLVEFGHQNFTTILWGAWLQAVGPVFIVFFALAIVYLSGATKHLAGWMTLFGACTLMTVSLIEITFYICALSPEPSVMGPIGIDLINSVQHLYFIVAAPAFFIPLGWVIMQSKILPRLLGLFAIMLGLIFAILGITTVHVLALPMWITALGGVQVLWWLSASGILISRAGKLAYPSFG
jgi:hypothetical protein